MAPEVPTTTVQALQRLTDRPHSRAVCKTARQTVVSQGTNLTQASQPPPVVVALGGNALIRPGEEGTVAQQSLRVAEVARHLVGLQTPGGLVVTHGNGPQVGRHLLRNDLTQAEVPPTPLDVAVAATQGEIGFLLQCHLRNALDREGCDTPVVGLITQVEVDPGDPAFLSPTKFVGRFYSESEARERAAALCWQVRQDADRGWRRVVASPAPLRIVERDTIASLCASGAVVVACGGGGVPVFRTHAGLAGAEAVIDKDRATALLAGELGARRLVILTGVQQVMVGFGTPSAQALACVGAGQMRAWLDAGEFPAGSMGPKVEAALSFLDAGGAEVLITTPEGLPAALRGGPHTQIIRE